MDKKDRKMKKYFSSSYLLILAVIFSICVTVTPIRAQILDSSYYSATTFKSQKKGLTIEKGIALEQALKHLKGYFNVAFLYRDDVVNNKKITKTMALPDNIHSAIKEVLKGQHLAFEKLSSKTYGIFLEKVIHPQKMVVAKQATVSGTVTDAQTGQPLIGVNILVVGSSTGTVTNVDGHYSLSVSSLQDSLRFTYIGYKTKTVAIGGRTMINIRLTSTVQNLNQLVVIGAGVSTQKKRLGTSVSTVASHSIENAPVSTISQVLVGRVPGLVSVPGGNVGSAAPIHIRGTVSLSQGSYPLVYVDGVRVNSKLTTFASMRISELNQINKNDIKNIEVLKGAAAATLFGTEASNGVIVITTKNGGDHPARWSLQTTQGISKAPLFRVPANYSYDSQSKKILSNYPASDYFKRAGYNQVYNLSVGGGSEKIGYYGSVRYQNVNGSLPTNGKNNMSFRANLNLKPIDGMAIQFGINVRKSNIRVPYPSWGLTGEFVLADPRNVIPGVRPYGELYHTIPGVLAYNNHDRGNERTIHSSIDYQVTKAFRLHALVGLHIGNGRTQIYVPPGPDLANPEGFRTITRGHHSETTASITGELKNQISDFFGNQLNIGVQSYWENTRQLTAGTKNFAVPQISVLNGGSTVAQIGETFAQVVSAGAFAQDQFGINNKLFLTVGLRLDGNSTFGKDLGFTTYPHAGLAWNISSESFWTLKWFDNLRFRASYGTSGLQPGVYDALRTWTVASLLGGKPALIPNSFGNNDLKPERSIEYEAGFDMGFLDNRLTLNLTYYLQRTKNAILNHLLAPSRGFLNPQVVNLGALKGRGLEVSADWKVLNYSNLGLDIHGTFATRHVIVTDLGGILPFRTAGANGDSRVQNYVQVGYEPGAIIAPVTNPKNRYQLSVPLSDLTKLSQIIPNYLMDSNGNKVRKYLGNQLPKTTGSLGLDLNLPKNFSISAMATFAGGFVMLNETKQVRVLDQLTKSVAEMNKALANPSTSNEKRKEIAERYSKMFPQVSADYYSSGNNIQIRAISLHWKIPESFLKKSVVKNAELSLEGHNLFLITGYDGMLTPGGVSSGSAPLIANDDYFSSPTPWTLQLKLNIIF